MTVTSGLSGRRGQAARNDEVILTAAREVFLANPSAPIAAVAERAAVGIGALYRRYAAKEDLLRKLCHDGLLRYIAEAEAAADEPDDWRAFTGFVERIVDADVHSLTVHLAGTFTPTEEMNRDAMRAGELAEGIFVRAHRSGKLRPEVVTADLVLVLEGCAAVRVPDAVRSAELRRRYLAVQLAGLSARDAGELPGPPPTAMELSWRWQQR
ncbi:AcrR family transcriptional regulator [Allocatelliglobosispora scoriae]|uniref:AcrR family transcriptional regulator n=1 Tax=Allocatelliglobosispora scoriae TaxID=643052 RepID=A0A841BN91_9ACTN|nr:helix-turn-helix domain-containing protein [Allocatelliglobosispora scoriae]MBB5868848.1 AcrR family transcriptional regulator [Allocatelliglobosispora scoriae]